MPPRAGETPTKVVFQGLEPGSAQAQALLSAKQGVLAQFQAKARQQRDLSAQGQFSVGTQLPGGGQARYVYNNGQETILVELLPEVIEPELRREKLPVPPKPAVTLEIDVILEPELYLAGDVYSYSDVTTTVPGTPILPIDPNKVRLPSEGWQRVLTSDFVKTYVDPYDPTYQSRPIPPNLFLDGAAVIHKFYPRYDFQYVKVYCINPEVKQPAISREGSNEFGYWDSFVQVPPSQRFCVLYAVAFATLKDGYDTAYNPAQVVRMIDAWENFEGKSLDYTGPSNPGGTTTKKQIVRDKRWLFNTNVVAGARVVPEKTAPYTAKSTGQFDDTRLKPMTTAGGSALTVGRHLGPVDGLSPLRGMSFLVTAPLLVEHQKPDKIVIEVYVASLNRKKANTSPGRKTSTFETDDPTFTYSDFRDVKLVVRAREFATETPQPVKVHLTTDKRTQHFTAPSAETEPSLAGPLVTSAGRVVDWVFGTGKKWTDTGLEPAKPDAPYMGELLAVSPVLALTVAADPTAGRSVPDDPAWPRPVTEMTRVATIEWTPPDDAPGAKGSAKITPA